MARHDHEQRVAELRRFGERVRRTNSAGELKSGQIRGIGPIALDAFGNSGVMGPKKDFIAAPGGHDGHRGAE